ncbi:MAG TPA: hypothetical protein VGO11_23040, partial [Chthoniobacteraceae bacterium]|nr:hypothetical protein [Chthoniobacteraceae bacterium]
AGNSAGFGTQTTNFSLNASNDQITIVKGAASNVSLTTASSLLVYAVQSDTTSPFAWDADRTSASTSARPTLSANPDLAPVLGNSNAAYSGALTATDKAGWLSRLANTGNPVGTGGNWTTSANALTLPSSPLSVTTGLTWNPAGAAGSTTWSSTTTSTNWLDGAKATWFNSGDLVAFTNTGVGAVSIAAGGVTPGAVSFTHTTGTYTVSGGPLAGTGSLSVSGGGTTILAGDNTFTGATTIASGRLEASAAGSNAALGKTSQVTVLAGGTLLLGSSNQLNDSAKVSLGGGTLNLHGNSEGTAGTAGVGALTLSATSTLDFGDTLGAGNLIQFAGIDQHTAGAILQIVDWDGPFSGGGGDRLLFSGSDATAFSSLFGQGEVSFNGIVGYKTVDFGTYYEVTAIPEPSTMSLPFLLLGLAAWRERRRVRECGRQGLRLLTSLRPMREKESVRRCAQRR